MAESEKREKDTALKNEKRLLSDKKESSAL